MSRCEFIVMKMQEGMNYISACNAWDEYVRSLVTLGSL